MSKDPRKPGSFSFDEPSPVEARMRKPGAFDAGVTLTPDELDPFLAEADALVPVPPPARRGFPFFHVDGRPGAPV